MIACRAGAEHARVRVGDVIADRAVGDPFLHVADRLAQTLGVLTRRPQDVKRQPLRALRADAGQLLQLLDKPSERFRKDTVGSEESRDLQAAEHALHD